MNEASVRAVPIMNGWEAQFRKVHRAAFEPVCVNGIAQLYETEEKALLAAYEALHKHLFGDGIVRDGERVSIARQVAEERFSKVFPGRGRMVEVERR